MNTKLSLIIAFTAASFIFSGCAKDAPKPKTQSTVYSKEDSQLFNRINQLGSKRLDTLEEQKDYLYTKSKMLQSDPVYASEKPAEALVENKKDDFITEKPMYLEPMFTKVEIMPYQTSNGLYHEQESAWLKVKDGEIVVKSNDYSNTVDTLNSSILSR